MEKLNKITFKKFEVSNFNLYEKFLVKKSYTIIEEIFQRLYIYHKLHHYWLIFIHVIPDECSIGNSTSKRSLYNVGTYI